MTHNCWEKLLHLMRIGTDGDWKHNPGRQEWQANQLRKQLFDLAHTQRRGYADVPRNARGSCVFARCSDAHCNNRES